MKIVELTRNKNQMMRKYERNISKLRRTQGCLTDAVAYWLNIHPENVPYFVYPRDGWNERLKKFFKKQGYEVYWKKDFEMFKTVQKIWTYDRFGSKKKKKLIEAPVLILPDTLKLDKHD